MTFHWLFRSFAWLILISAAWLVGCSSPTGTAADDSGQDTQQVADDQGNGDITDGTDTGTDQAGDQTDTGGDTTAGDDSTGDDSDGADVTDDDGSDSGDQGQSDTDPDGTDSDGADVTDDDGSDSGDQSGTDPGSTDAEPGDPDGDQSDSNPDDPDGDGTGSSDDQTGSLIVNGSVESGLNGWVPGNSTVVLEAVQPGYEGETAGQAAFGGSSTSVKYYFESAEFQIDPSATYNWTIAISSPAPDQFQQFKVGLYTFKADGSYHYNYTLSDAVPDVDWSVLAGEVGPLSDEVSSGHLRVQLVRADDQDDQDPVVRFDSASLTLN